MFESPAKFCVLTGGRGFVGAAVARQLATQGWSTRLALHRPWTGALPAHATAFLGSLGTPADWSMSLAGCDAVLHLAARAHILHDDATDPLAAYRAVNTAATLHLATQAAAAGVRRFVFVSTV